MKHVVTYNELGGLVIRMARRIQEHCPGKGMDSIRPPLRVYPVPRGGIPVALALSRWVLHMDIVSEFETADVIVDDLIDSGTTMQRYPSEIPFEALIDKRDHKWNREWIVFPWEGDADGGVEDNVRRLLQFVGEDPARGGLLETPGRVARAWSHWCRGYAQDPAEVLKVFEDGAEGCDEMVVVKDIPFYSKCEHHMADIFGTATIAYVPDGRIVGLSKLNRLLDVFARRLQVQERLTTQVADALTEHLRPRGCGVVIKARHMCMESRGVCQQGHHTVTSALRGVFKTQASTRAEFLALAHG